MLRFALTCLFLSTSYVWAADQTLDLTTSDGRLVRVDVYNPGAERAVILAPGAGCSSRLDMYDAFGAQARAQGMTLVRLYWAYCVKDPANGKYSDDLSLEKIDLQKVLAYVRSLGFADPQIAIGGKSLGSLVSQPLFAEEKALASLVLLTPVCSDPDSGANIFSEQYPGLESETRPVFLIQGKLDPLCKNEHFEEYLKNKAPNMHSHVVEGDHGFGIKNPDGTYNAELGLQNLQGVANWLFGVL